MAHSETIDRLKAANPADAGTISAELRDEGIDRARSRVAEIISPLDAPHRAVEAPVRRKRSDIALGALALLVLAALTPPVQALAERLGEIVGIGDEPSRNATGPIDEPAIVIDSGQSPNGTPYEVVASADMNIYYDESPQTCLGLDLPESGGPNGAGCLSQDVQDLLDAKAISPIAFLGPEELGADQLIVDGLASKQVDSVEIERRTENGVDRYAAAVSTLSEDLASEIGASDRASFFLAFLPADLVPPFDPERPTEPFVLPAPAPGTIGQGPVIGRDDVLVPRGVEGLADSPAERALAQITVVAYDSQGQEIGRVPLLRGPSAEARLYSQHQHPSRVGRERDRILEACYQDTLRRYGEPGQIKPQLPHVFEQDLTQCLREEYATAP